MTIRSTTICAVAAITAQAMAAPAFAQANANAPATGSMTLFLPIAVAKLSDLSFGTVIRPQTGAGTVSIDAATGQINAGGGAALMNGGPNAPPSRATFQVTGEGGMNFSVTVPATFNMARSGGLDPIQVTLTSTAGGGTLSGTYGQAGAATFGVGGSVQISSATPSGAYTGAFTVTVAYN